MIWSWGLDPGAVKYSYREKDITLLAAKELKTLLDKKGYQVYLTRNKDEFISLRKRRNIAKKIIATYLYRYM